MLKFEFKQLILPVPIHTSMNTVLWYPNFQKVDEKQEPEVPKKFSSV
jgi:hypothetical protein